MRVSAYANAPNPPPHPSTYMDNPTDKHLYWYSIMFNIWKELNQ